MQGKRVLVVGASSGIGRAAASRAVARGASVVFSARRAERLDEAVEAAGSGHAISVNVRDPQDCEQLIATAVAQLGGLDAVLYATGVSPLRKLRDTASEMWADVLETNLIGAHLLARAASPHLAHGGVFAVVSSDSVGAPRPGLVPYAASKAALEELVRGWRVEHPEVRYSVLAVGPTFPTEFGASFDAELTMEMFAEWTKHGMVHSAIMDTDNVGEVLIDTVEIILRHPTISLEYMVLRPTAAAEQPPAASS